MKNYFTRTVAALSLVAMPYLTTGCASFGTNLGNTISNALSIPISPVVGLIEEGDPGKGLREGVFDFGESVYKTVANKEAPAPEELGEANEFVNKHKPLEIIIDTGIAFGTGQAIAGLAGASATHVYQAGVLAGAGEAAVKGIKEATK